MARRSAAPRGPAPDLEGGPGLPSYPAVLGRGVGDPSWPEEDSAATGTRPARGRGRTAGPRRPPRRGSGGRWWLWLGRALLWALLVVVLVNGVRAIVDRAASPASSGSPVTGEGVDPRRQFPSAAAAAYALDFAQVYLNMDEARAAEREQRLAAFLPEGSDPQFGWSGVGFMELQSAQVAGVDVRDARNAVVTLLVRVNGRSMRLAVPVYGTEQAMVVSGRPALLPPPAKAVPPQPPSGDRDSELEADLEVQLPAFFRAYAASDKASLERYLVPGVSLAGLDGAVGLAGLRGVFAPVGGTTRQVFVTVSWRAASPLRPKAVVEFDQTYELTVVQENGKWNVNSIRGSTQPVGP